MNYQDTDLFIANQEIYNYYRERLINVALSQFEWHGLPETCDRLYFEKRLLFDGKACMLKPIGSEEWLSLGYVTNGSLNVYGYPTDILGVGFNATNIQPEVWEFLYDNMTKQSLLPKIDLYARLLWEVHNTFRSNLKHQNTPFIVTGTKNQELSFKNLFNRIFGFQPYILMKRPEDAQAIQVLQTGVEYRGNELLDSLKVIWAEALSMLGITAETTKKERLIEGEITMDRQEDLISLNSRLLNRVEFCNKMNEKYGMELSVNLSSEDYELNPFRGDYAMQLMAQSDVANAEARKYDGSLKNIQRRTGGNG